MMSQKTKFFKSKGRRDFKLSFAGFGIDLSFLQTTEKLFSQFAPKRPFSAQIFEISVNKRKIGYILLYIYEAQARAYGPLVSC